jgi:hypothetical protein
MTAEQEAKREWLNRAFYAEKKLNALLHKRECDRQRAQRITAAIECNDKGKSDSRSNGTEEALFKLLGSDEEYSIYLKEYLDIRHEIETAIYTLEDPELEAVLIYRYLDFMPSLEKIAEKMSYSYETIKNKHKKGLNCLKIYP